MTFYSGQNGQLQIENSSGTFVTIAKVTNWSISSSQSPLQTTTLQDTDATYINGIRSATGSCRLYYYDSGSGTTASNSCSTLIKKLIKARDSGEVGVANEPENVTFKLQVLDGTTTPKQIEVEALLTSASMSMAVGEVLAADVAFQVNGAPISVTI